ncbi:hypothetical protein LCGC14_1713170 [marine sediment metagenome]|uniref:Uncharacterized protein n=1 Tax=marine sediment metagenome TaxID=412755 RepID=A0A0F9JV34_9ZZZZ
MLEKTRFQYFTTNEQAKLEFTELKFEGIFPKTATLIGIIDDLLKGGYTVVVEVDKGTIICDQKIDDWEIGFLPIFVYSPEILRAEFKKENQPN